MKKSTKALAYFLALASCISCAKTINESDSEAAKREFEAFIHVNYPELEGQQIGNGIYILEDTPGTGDEITNKDTEDKYGNYIFYNYTVRDLYTRSIIAYNKGTVAKNRNEYKPLKYYGPAIMFYGEDRGSAMFHETVTGGGKYDRMKVGGTRTAIIPSWISNSASVKDSAEEYLDVNAEGKSVIYEIEAVSLTGSIKKYQIDTIETYLDDHHTPISDTTGCYGFYFHRNKVREAQRGVTVKEDVKFPSDTTIYVEYIGRLLNGRVFDTNIKDTAIKYGLGTRSSSYSPARVTWSTDSLGIQMGGNSVIKGFSYALWHMHPFESADAFFISTWGYGGAANGDAIPAHSPLLFEINIVPQP